MRTFRCAGRPRYGRGVTTSTGASAPSPAGSIADLFRALSLSVTPQTFGYAVWSVKISQVAAILPYMLLVLILIFRPKGLFGTREG